MYQYRALLDVDEVLVDFQGPALRVMADITGIVYKTHEIDSWDIFDVLTKEQRAAVWAVVQKPGFCASLKPHAGAIEAVREMRRCFSDVHAVTSPFYGARTWVQERTEFLADVFGLTDEDVTHTRAKWGVYGDAILDDKPAMPQRWAKCHPGGLAMLFHTPNTSAIDVAPIPRVHSYEQAIGMMKNHAERRQGACTRCERDK